MADETAFLPAGRLTRSQILKQAESLGESLVLSAMLDTAPGLVLLLNPQRQIVLCNEASARAGGLTAKEEALGMRPGELLRCIHSADRPGGCGTSESCRYCSFAEALVAGSKGSNHSGECILECHDEGRDSSAEYAVEVRPVASLGIGWMSCSLNDMSAQKRREALERTFFHDILNRASAVEGVSEILTDEDTSAEDFGDLLGMLSLSSHALVDEIRSQRTLLAAEKGELGIELSTCDSIEALRATAAACQSFGFAEHKRLAIAPDAQQVLFSTDATLLGRVLINLLKNALEATDPGGNVTATCTRPAPDRIRFSVHNETVMPHRVRAHVFQRSFTTKGTGRGLGTYSVKLLTESYLGGRAWFDCAPGEGTTFNIEFVVGS